MSSVKRLLQVNSTTGGMAAASIFPMHVSAASILNRSWLLQVTSIAGVL